MKYNFNEPVERRGTGCVKYDMTDKNLIPLWVADMDFKTPDFIMEAIGRRLECPVLGYPIIPDDYFPTISSWVKKIHGWNVAAEEIRYVPGVVKGIALAECAFLTKGDKDIIQPPVYHPFRIATEKLGMDVLYNPLKEMPDGSYSMDFDSLERCIGEGGRMLLLSNPQNPSGQCWPEDTLRRLAEITSRAGVIVISDEIHGEMAHRGFRHVPYASVCPEAAGNSITFMAPSKTFNIAGVVSSYTIIKDPSLRKKFFGFLEATEQDYPSIFSIEATMAAYREGAAWRREMLRYVEGNIAYVCKFIDRHIPSLKAIPPQASFLIWIDCRGLGLPQDKLMEIIEKKAGLFLNDGSMFGIGGEGFVRLNTGCPRSTLVKAMKQLKNALA